MTNSTTITTPHRINEDTWLIPELASAGPMGFVPMNSLVIAGEQPVIVDTGNPFNREAWTEMVFSIVDPDDVRWIFLSHDDVDHYGNLLPALDLCPNATLVTSWFQCERMKGGYQIPLPRCRWVEDGESFDVGDRTLVAVRPPLYDSPTTRGLFDARTGVYWASDCFAAAVPFATHEGADLERPMWREVLQTMNRAGNPWVELVDPARFGAAVDAVERLDITAIASAHGSVLRGSQVDDAFAAIRELPELEAVARPGQAVLDMILAEMAAAPVPA